MADAATDAAAARASEQARLRKERREAKIKAGGSARLNRITGLGGGVQREPLPQVPPAGPDTSTPATSTDQNTSSEPGAGPAPPGHHEDPSEVDISEHFYEPRTTPRARVPTFPTSPVDPSNMTEAQLRQMMLGFDRTVPPTGAGSNQFPGAGFNSDGPAGEDPIMSMLSKMMGANGPGAGPFGTATSPPFGAGLGQQKSATSGAPDRYAAIWRILHVLLALGLGLFVVMTTTFSGTKLERERAAVGGSVVADGGSSLPEVDDSGKLFFWVYATAETVLLTTRFFLDRGREAPSGFLWTVTGFLPPPFKGYLETALRYGQMLSTVRADLCVCVFVLGVSSWIRGF